jgi:hypothetical protein
MLPPMADRASARRKGRVAWPRLCPALLGGSCGAPDRPVRIVLVTLDNLRYDAVFDEQPAMPRLAAFAQRAAVFHQAYSSTSST